MPDIYDTHPTLYKLVSMGDVPDEAWANRSGWATAFSKLDDPKYFKLQFGEQLAGIAAEPPFAGRDDLMLLTWNVESMCEEADIKVVVEEGEPRAYVDFIPYACMSAPPKVLALKDGKHVLPLFGADATAGGGLSSSHPQLEHSAFVEDCDGFTVEEIKLENEGLEWEIDHHHQLEEIEWEQGEEYEEDEGDYEDN